MSVFKRGKYYYTKFEINGKKVYETTKRTRKVEAEKYEANLRNSLDPKRGYTVNDVALLWIDDDAPKSMYSHIRPVLEHMADIPLSESIKAASEMKRKMLKAGLNPQTVNRRLAVVRRILNKAHKEYFMLKEPLGTKISPLMTSEKEFERQVFLSVDEVTRLFEPIKDPEVKKFLIGLCSTGLRFSEMMNLRPDQFKNGTVRLDTKTKSKRPRWVPVPEWAHYAFADLPIKTTTSIVRNAFEGAREAQGMTHVRMHDLRHTFASWLAMNPTIPFTVIRDLMGHSSSKVTDKYTHLRQDSLKNATDKLREIK